MIIHDSYELHDQITGAARGIGKAADAAVRLKGKYGTG